VVWVLDAPLDRVPELAASGAIVEQRLPSGRTVWVSGPGVTLFGVTPAYGPDQPLKEFLN
jgi:hypothetical protein